MMAYNIAAYLVGPHVKVGVILSLWCEMAAAKASSSFSFSVWPAAASGCIDGAFSL